MHASIDTSTLNFEEIRKLPTCELSPSRTLGPYGSGCHLDAPGFPSYMVQPIYTRRGDTPQNKNAPTMVLAVEDTLRVLQRNTFEGSWDAMHAAYQKILHRIWKPLPMEHERVQMWMANVYRHFHHCYQDMERPDYNRPGTLIYPIPSYKKELPRTFHASANASDEEMTLLKLAMQAEMDRVRSLNDLEESRAKRIATPENHQAVLAIREFYPDYQPNLEWIANPPKSMGQEDWWETAATQPEPSECIHRNALRGSRVPWTHPTEPGKHCLWCGRTNPMPEEVPHA